MDAREASASKRCSGRSWLVAMLGGAVLGASGCNDFRALYDECVDAGRCEPAADGGLDGGGAGGGASAGAGGGPGGGTTGGGGADGAGGGGAGGGSAGGCSAGGGTSGGGAGGGGADEFTTLSVPSSGGYVVGLWGNDAGVYAGTSAGELWLLPPGSSEFSVVVGAPATSNGRQSVYATGTGVFYGGGTRLVACEARCTEPGDWVSLDLPSGVAGESINAVCGHGAEVFAVGWRDTNHQYGVAYRWDAGGRSWVKVSDDLQVMEPRGCVASAAGLSVAARQQVAQLVGTQLTVTDAGTEFWNAIGTDGTMEALVGETGKVMSRKGSEPWRSVPGVTVSLRALAARPGGGLWVGGDFPGPVLWHLDGGSLAAVGRQPDFKNVRAIWVAGPSTVYVGGIGSSGSSASVVRWSPGGL